MSGLPADSLRVRWAIGVVLFIATVLLFSRSWSHDFVNYDDPDYVTANAHVKAGLTGEGVAWALRSGEASNWHPLTWVSHMLDVSLFGMSARGHHATSVLLHALNAVLAFVALRRLTGALWASAVFAALFAWHPLRVESVAWVSERKDVLSGLFWFLVLWAYAVYVERRREQRGGAWWFYAAALVAFALGLMAKPMLVTLPCVLLLLDGWPLRRLGKETGVCIAEKLPFFALVVGSAVVTFIVQKGGGSVSAALTLDQRLSNAVVASVRYLGNFFAPLDLAVLYPHPGDWPMRKVVASAVILLAVTAAACWQVKRRPWLLVGWLWFLGTLVPVIGLVQVGIQSMADRYTYLPMLGVQLALLWTLREWWPKPSAVPAAVAAVALTICAIATWRQIGVWQNSFTLFDRAIAVTQNNYLAYNNRALWLCEAGRVEEGIADYRRSLEIRPDYPEASNNLGRVLVQRGQPAPAVPLLRKALAGKPTSLEVRNNLANALSDTGAVDEAMQLYDEILRENPEHANALNGLGVALAMKGKPAEARAKIEASLKIAPNDAGAHSNLGNVLSMLGQLDDAARHYRSSAQLQPTAHTHAVLGYTLLQLGRKEEAVAELRSALRLQPDHPQAKAWLAGALGGQGGK
ncbi:MAG: tetratricopeptide repeat protein [Verrucomicrobiota bacterium]